MSSSSEGSLAELPLPFDISSAVSRALRINSTGSLEENVYQRRGGRMARSFSYPTGYYDLPAHQASTSRAYNVSQTENYSSGYYCSSSNSNPYFYSIPSSAGMVETQPYFYPQHHYPAIHPADIQMEVEAWTENTSMSLCNSSSDMLESQANMEQLDQFCKYIDSSGDEELIVDGGESNMLGHAAANYDCYIASGVQTAMIGSPPKKKRKNFFPVMSLPSYYEEEMDEDMGEWKVELENSSIWKEFDSVGTEMVITKAGRRMFPTLSVRVYGLDPTDTYSVKLDIVPADNRRYKYLQTDWVAVGRSDKKQVYCEYEHPDSPNSGSYWMDKIIAFKMVKLTNNKTTKYPDQVILNSMHKYIPCMKILCQTDGMSQSFSFPETSFIAVTAYQSTGVTQLKINNNPYARAFRESLPSNSSQRSGGHCRHSSNRSSINSISPTHTAGNRSQPPSPKSSTQVQSKQKTPCHSSVSVESGFESDTTNDKRKDSTSLIGPQTGPYNCRHSMALMTYWAEDHSLWNPNIIAPDPIMENNASSFSITYLEDTSRETEYAMRADCDGSPKNMLDNMIPKADITFPGNVEPNIPVDDDVFF